MAKERVRDGWVGEQRRRTYDAAIQTRYDRMFPQGLEPE